MQGIRDPIDASAQLLTHILPSGVVEAGNAANNWLADKTGLVGRLPEGGIDQEIADMERKYQESRSGNAGIDWARIGGNVISPVNLAIAAKVPAVAAQLVSAAPSIGGRLATAAGTGTVYGATSAPVTEGDFWKKKGTQTAIGAAVGPVAEVIGSSAARLVNPQTREAVRKLMDEGITPTPGQILGGRWQVLEDKLTSIPILGDVISYSRGKGLDELNMAAYKRALEPIGGTAPKSVGREGVAAVREQISKAYDDLLPKVTFQADPQFAADIKTLHEMASALPIDLSKRFDKVLRETVIKKISKQGTMDGIALKGLESELGELSSGFKRDPFFDNRQLGAAIGEIQSAIRSNLERTNPQYAGELKAANQAWANYVRIRDAASRQGAESGKFTPAQLSAAVKAQDKSKGKRAFSEGTALMQDLSDPAKESLASKYPDSGTPGRLLAMLGISGGGAFLSPTIAALGGLSTVPYLPGGRGTVAALLARRPQGAEVVANRIRELGPRMSPALIELLKPMALQRND